MEWQAAAAFCRTMDTVHTTLDRARELAIAAEALQAAMDEHLGGRNEIFQDFIDRFRDQDRELTAMITAHRRAR